MTAFDYLIVGQGLAGTALAWHLRWSGCRVLVLDRGDAITSSRIAAGLLTPITGKRLALTWRFAELWPVAVAFYRRVEAETSEAFFREWPMVRLFQNDEEREVFAKRAASEFRGLVRQPEPLVNADCFTNPLGGFEMTQAGQLATERYLDASRVAFERDGGFRVAEIDASDIELSPSLSPPPPGGRGQDEPDGVRLPRLGITARALVFCEGFAANPWFPIVRFNAVKGEILTLRIPGLTGERIVHRGVWLMPVGGEVFRAGSTYDSDTLDCVPTARGRDEIVSRLRQFLRLPFEVIDHTAAVRPATEDQRPVVGVHHEFPQLAVLNGFGSKGSLQAPYFAEQLATFLACGSDIEPEVDVWRGVALPRLTGEVHTVVRAALKPGDIAVDATVGNGRDARLLAECVGPWGKVFAFDVQAVGLERAAAYLAEHEIHHVELLCRDHGEMGTVLKEYRGRVGAVMFNLGYLPGGEKAITTTAATTVPAIRAALELLRPGGVLTVVAYTIHPGGVEEADAVRKLLCNLPTEYEVRESQFDRRKPAAPRMFVVRRDAGGVPAKQG